VLVNLGQLRHSGLTGEVEDTVVALALDLALGVDGGHVSGARGGVHVDSLRAALATLTGPVAATLIAGLSDAAQPASPAGGRTASHTPPMDGDRLLGHRAQA
jgi:hypothetical protein